MKVRTLRWSMMAMLVASFMVIGTGTAFGQTPVTLINADFEDDDVLQSQGCCGNAYTAAEFGAAWYTNEVAPTGWANPGSLTYPFYTGTVNIGVLNSVYSSYPAAVGGGTNALGLYSAWYTYTSYAGNGMVQSSTDLIVDGQTYTLTADGNSWDFDTDSRIRVEMYYIDAGADDTNPANRTKIVDATYSFDLGPVWDPILLEFNSGSVPGSIGKEIGVLLDAPFWGEPGGGAESIGVYPLIDNVAISYVATPIVIETAITASSPFAVEDVNFSLTAPGTGPFGWTRDGNSVGGNTKQLDFLPLATGDEGTYLVTYDDGSKAPNTSDPYFVEVLASGTSIPVAGLLGLGLLASACAMGGASVLRRKK